MYELCCGFSLQAMLQYLLDYTLGKKLEDHLQFYVSQLSYELESGRESTLEMLAAFFTSFPQVSGLSLLKKVIQTEMISTSVH